MRRLKKPVFQNLEDVPGLKENPDVPKYDFDAIAERNQILEKALQRIPEDERVLITLYYLNESDVDEIHVITGLSKSNVKVKLFRARKKLQELVSKMTETSYI
jgi:RNA polymerase sigma-70 factor (ECF subfamily)